MFLYLPFQNVHGPTQAPQEYVDKYQFIDQKTRREYAAMVDIVDEAIGNVTQTLEQSGWVKSRQKFALKCQSKLQLTLPLPEVIDVYFLSIKNPNIARETGYENTQS